MQVKITLDEESIREAVARYVSSALHMPCSINDVALGYSYGCIIVTIDAPTDEPKGKAATTTPEPDHF